MKSETMFKEVLEKKQIIDQNTKEKRIHEIMKTDIQRTVRMIQGQANRQYEALQSKQKKLLALLVFSNMMLGFKHEKQVHTNIIDI